MVLVVHSLVLSPVVFEYLKLFQGSPAAGRREPPFLTFTNAMTAVKPHLSTWPFHKGQQASRLLRSMVPILQLVD
jgi:hypothetical protein